MKRLPIFGILAAFAAFSLSFSACEDGPNVGSSLVEDETEVVEVSDFVLNGTTVNSPRVQTRDVTQVIGSITADGYGSLDAGFVTQFLPAAVLPSDLTRENIDSLLLRFYIYAGDFVGDSIAPMGLQVYELNKQLPSVMYSNYDPADYYDTSSEPLATKIYTTNVLGATDSIKKLTYREVDVKLPLSTAHKLYDIYANNPEAYQFPATFAKLFPGIYVKNSFGSGRVTSISNTVMTLFYHTTTEEDGETKVNKLSGDYYAVAPEMILNNFFTYNIDRALDNRIAAGENIIVAPVGRDVEITFPIDKVIDYYNANSGSLSVVNTLTMTIPAEAIENDYDIEQPPYLLMVLSKNKDQFFANNELVDNKTSFYAAYSSTDKAYKFSGLRSYLLKMLEQGTISPEDYTFTLTPVNVVMETNTSNSYYGSTTQYLSSINPYIGKPVMVKLNLDKATIELIFAKQSAN